jgi:hypothetical protein
MKVSAARPAQVRGVVVGDVVVDGAAVEVLALLAVVPDTGDDVEEGSEDPAGVPGFVEEVATFAAVPQAHREMTTPTVAMRMRRPWPDVEGDG